MIKIISTILLIATVIPYAIIPTKVNANIYGTGLVGYWTFDRTRYGTGASAVIDSSGTGNHGTQVGTPTENQYGIIQQSLLFNGIDDQINTPITTALTDFTACAWFKTTGSSGYMRIIDKEYLGGFWMGNEGNGTTNWGGGIRYNDTNPFLFITLTNLVWHHMCMSRSGTTQRIFADGGLTTASQTVTSTALNTSQMFIGSSNGFSTDYFIGNIDDVRIYNRALSTSEMAKLYYESMQNYQEF